MTRKVEKKGMERMEEGGGKQPKGTAVPRRERQPVSSTTHQAYNQKVQPRDTVKWFPNTSYEIYLTILGSESRWVITVMGHLMVVMDNLWSVCMRA